MFIEVASGLTLLLIFLSMLTNLPWFKKLEEKFYGKEDKSGE